MKIIIDANVIFAALIKDSTTRGLIIFLEADFYFPEPLLKEIEKYKELIKEKAGFTEDDFHEDLKGIFEYIQIIPSDELRPFINKAKIVMDSIDPKDSVVLAAALAHIGSIIWSTDKHLHMQKLVRVIKTNELLNEYKKRLMERKEE